MPGDPLRAARLADRFLADAEKVTDVRGMGGYTGTWKGVPVSVMPSGMGMPSAAIYITELIREYGVTTLIRVGTAGAYQPDLALRKIVAADSAQTNSNLPNIIGATEPLSASPRLLATAAEVASTTGVDLAIGPIFSSDTFYEPTFDGHERNTAAGLLCVEMECAALYGIASLEGAEALTLMTMTDHLATGEQLSSEDRQNSVDEMLELALNIAASAAS